MISMRIFFAVGVFSSFDVRFKRGNHRTIPSEIKIWENFKNRRKNENIYQFLRRCFINPVHNWDNLSQLFCLSRLLSFCHHKLHQAAPRETRAKRKNKKLIFKWEKEREKHKWNNVFRPFFFILFYAFDFSQAISG